MKRRAVRLTSPLPGDSILEALQSAAEAESAVENMLFELDALESVDLPALDFRDCLCRRVQFSYLRARRTFFTNCRFESCDFAGQTFRDGTVSRAEFVGCRGAGAAFEKMKLRDVLFRDCRLSDATLAECDLGRVELADCDLSRSMLYECAQKELVLEKCNLTEAELSGTSMAGVDLSGCTLDGLIAHGELLRGATVSMDQAPLLMALFGISVKI